MKDEREKGPGKRRKRKYVGDDGRKNGRDKNEEVRRKRLKK